MGKYKVGDKVRIVDKWGEGCFQNSFGKMDKWLGKTMTIQRVRTNFRDDTVYKMEEDQKENYGYGWAWNDACIAGIARKFNVGERYKVGNYGGSESGNIIEITEYENIRGWELYHYRTIYGRNPQTSPSFDLNSAFGQSLIPVTGDNEKIIIIRDGRNVTARKYVDEQLVNTAVAKCHPDDTFDFDTGARIAFERLLGVPEEENVVLEYEAPEDFCIKSSSQSNEIRIGKYILSIREDDNHVYN